MAQLKTEHAAVKGGDRGEALPPPEVDTSILDFNLSLSVEERIRNHERSRRLADELRQAGSKAHGERKP